MYLVLLHFPSLCFIDIVIFYKLKVCVNPISSKSLGAVFSNSICSLHVLVSHESHFGYSHNSSNFFIIIFIMVNCNLIFDVTITILEDATNHVHIGQ